MPYNFDQAPRQGEYLWDYMDRIGVPRHDIMEELEKAAKEMEGKTSQNATWHGSGLHRWLDVDGKSDTQTLWRDLQPYLKSQE